MATAQQTRHPHIVQSTSIQGGEPTLRDSRIPVRSVVQYVLKQGLTPEALVKEFRGLSLAAIYDALSFYYDHRPFLDKLIRQQAEPAWRR